MAISKLLSIAGPALSASPARIEPSNLHIKDTLGDSLCQMLWQRDGFYAFESALHVFPASPGDREPGLLQWNSPDLWRHEYGDLTRGATFFAEDAFGNQFCLSDRQVFTFDAETGELTKVANDLEGWADSILKEYKVLTGHPLMHHWQVVHGPIKRGTRLMPKTPFVLGGKYSLENLYALDSISAMRSRGNLAVQLKDLPDGTKVEFRVVP